MSCEPLAIHLHLLVLELFHNQAMMTEISLYDTQGYKILRIKLPFCGAGGRAPIFRHTMCSKCVGSLRKPWKFSLAAGSLVEPVVLWLPW